jgi:RNA polymerase sigma factor (sigma-70 family)
MTYPKCAAAPAGIRDEPQAEPAQQDYREGDRGVRRSSSVTHPFDVARGTGSPAGPRRNHPDSGTDEDVLADSLRSPEAFGELYTRHFASVYRYVAGRLGPDVADDLAAETFLAAFRRRAKFDPDRGSVRPWLYGIATNLVAQHHRSESRWYAALARAGADPLLPIAGSEEDRIADRVTAARARPALAAALSGLPDRDRDVLLLTAIGGLSYAEVAFALAIPEGTVGSRLSRARRKIIAALRGTSTTTSEFPAQLRRN